MFCKDWMASALNFLIAVISVFGLLSFAMPILREGEATCGDSGFYSLCDFATDARSTSSFVLGGAMCFFLTNPQPDEDEEDENDPDEGWEQRISCAPEVAFLTCLL
mmetsp:Transcript_75884/g.210597  ORF Transcript_75884/g.210597 Transcript_75884/m.210597 type:complete len:106 (-) Transcript_75884:99-416(-)